ncbi:MAG: hypothetical protein J6J17_05090 [Bacilli bacterium]|nr:hypothetical protein [Bacilli bacterium]
MENKDTVEKIISEREELARKNINKVDEEKSLLDEIHSDEAETIDEHIKKIAQLEAQKKHFQNMQLKKYQRKLKFKKFKPYLIGFSLGVVAVVASKAVAYNNSVEKKIEVLEDEINTHAGYSNADGNTIDLNLEHDCEIFDKNVENYEEGIIKYCEKNDLEMISEDAVRKFELKWKNDPEADDINLQEIYDNNLSHSKSNGM